MKDEIKVVRKTFENCAKFANCHRIRSRDSHEKNSTLTHYEPLRASEYLQIMDDNYGSCKNPGSPYVKIGNWVQTSKLEYDRCRYKTWLLNNMQLK